MGRRFACLMLLSALISVAVVASTASKASRASPSVVDALRPSNTDAWKEVMTGKGSVHGPPSTSIAENKIGNATTMGIVTQLSRLVHPFTEIGLLLLDSWLRNTRNKALPCKVSSFVPLKGSCTPIQ